MEKQDVIKRIKELKAQKQALIVAHYYVQDAVQAIADYVGDSYYLSKICKERKENFIIFCGVEFMGESAKILNPEKKIIMANSGADCPMAHMIEVEDIENVRGQYEDLAVVCYINSTAQIKAHSDVIVTSSNAYHIVSQLKEKNIFFIPDQHLGGYLSTKLPDKHFILNKGFCHVHTSITKVALEEAMEKQPDAKVLVHPECPLEIIELADYVGSTSGILKYASQSEASKFIVCTEMGILYELKQRNPNKQFYLVGHHQMCPNMKSITLEDVCQALEGTSQEVIVDANIARKAKRALLRMHELGE